MTLALQLVLSASCVYWLVATFYVWRTVRAVPRLQELTPPEPPRWPRLSVLVPARDEADTLPAAMAAKLADGYPDLELIVIDDRSTDGTGALVDRLAASDPRVRALHVTELPPGWLGKVHALQKGVEVATGELLLFTDADVHFAPGALARAVAVLEERRADLLGVLPSFLPAAFLVDVVLCVTTRMIAFGARAWAVDDPRSSAYLGVGAFNLVRRSALDRTPGLEWLRLEVCDDLGVGLLLKRAGARISLINGHGMVRVQWYPTLAGYARGAARSAFAAVGRFRASRMLLATLVGTTVELGPFVAAAVGPGAWLHVLGACASAVGLGCAVVAARWVGLPTVAALALPFGILVQAGVSLRAAILGGLRGGIEWRTTFYESRVLREAQRVLWP